MYQEEYIVVITKVQLIILSPTTGRYIIVTKSPSRTFKRFTRIFINKFFYSVYACGYVFNYSPTDQIESILGQSISNSNIKVMYSV